MSKEVLSNFIFSKEAPKALAMEEAIIGALMLDKDALAIIMDILRPESFYLQAHQLIFKAMVSLFEKSEPIDLLTVAEHLRSSGDLEKSGGAYYLIELGNRVASSANIEYHARIVTQKHIQRELIRISSETIKQAYDTTYDVFQLLGNAEQSLYDIAQQNLKKSYSSIGSLLGKAIKEVETASQQDDGLTGVPSGFAELDKLTSGWQPSDLIIVAARPSMGKTAITLAFARNAAMDFGKPVAIFSLEMSQMQMVKRLISLETEIQGEKIKTGRLEDYEWQQLNQTVESMSEAPIFIDDTPAINIFELRAKCRRLKTQHDIQMVIIDYLQLMSGGDGNNKKGNREQEVGSISRALKSMAKELNIPVVALSQLSRAVETRGGTKRPQLSDLRESGSIEQDADVVTFLYRPEYYQITEDEQGNSLKGVAEYIIAKHRNGSLSSVRLRFISELAKFTSPTHPSFEDSNFAPRYNDTITYSSRLDNDLDDVPF